jgi:hypothetical protein
MRGSANHFSARFDVEDMFLFLFLDLNKDIGAGVFLEATAPYG